MTEFTTWFLFVKKGFIIIFCHAAATVSSASLHLLLGGFPCFSTKNLDTNDWIYYNEGWRKWLRSAVLVVNVLSLSIDYLFNWFAVFAQNKTGFVSRLSQNVVLIIYQDLKRSLNLSALAVWSSGASHSWMDPLFGVKWFLGSHLEVETLRGLSSCSVDQPTLPSASLALCLVSPPWEQQLRMFLRGSLRPMSGRKRCTGWIVWGECSVTLSRRMKCEEQRRPLL